MKVFLRSKTLLFSVFALLGLQLGAQSSGTKDASFIVGTGCSHIVNELGILPNGNIFVGGDFDTYKGQLHTGIVVLNPNGTPDSTFSANALLNTGSDVRAGFVEPNGNILIGGFFTTVNGSAQKNLARFKPNGHRDSSFTVGTGANNEVTCISSNGQKIAISGFFSQYNGNARQGFAFLENDGTLDTNFTNPTWTSQIRAQYVLPNNKVLIGGNFSSFQSAPFDRIARLNADGSVDTSFNPGSGAGGPVEAIVLQPNGQIIIGGSFTTYNGQSCNRVARLNPNGSLDTSFNVALGPNSTVRALAVTANGKIVVAGQFLTFNGSSVNFIVQLNANGSVDGNFMTGTGFNGSTHALAIQPDNKILVGGAFTQFQGSASARIIRLHGDSISSSPTPIVPAFSQPQYTATCFGDTVLLEITGGNIDPADHWEWRVNDCLTSLLDTGLTVKFAPQSDTTTFAVKSSGAQTCTNVQLIVTDTVPPQLATTLPTISKYCEVNILPQDVPAAIDFCVGPVNGMPQGQLSYSSPGSYVLPWLFDDGHGNTATHNQQIEVLAIDTSVVYLGNYLWEANHTSSTAKYQWAACFGNQLVPIADDTLKTFIPQQTAEYAVIITEGSCSDTSSCHEMFAWDVPEFAVSSLLKIYPNPAQDEVLVSFPEQLGDGELTVLNLNSQVLMTANVSPGVPQNVSVKDLPKGVYLIQIRTANETMTQRLVKL